MFLRDWTHFDKVWTLEHCVLSRMVVDKLWASERRFVVKIGKKGYPTDFFDPEYKVVMTDSTFFLSKMGMTAGKIGKKGHPKDFFDPEYNLVLADFTVFLSKTEMTAGVFHVNLKIMQ